MAKARNEDKQQKRAAQREAFERSQRRSSLMGVVFGARDTRLGRQVALKVLPPAFTSDAEYLSRFHREGRLLAALNHPNIATLYGVEETSEVTALVMELVDGKTLTERIVENSRRGLSIDTAVGFAEQIADAIAAAHERGIVHRDLKPGNIKITTGGVVKVLDFGLAKYQAPAAATPRSSGIEMTQTPTVLPSATRAGVILGTAAYMVAPRVRDRFGTGRRAGARPGARRGREASRRGPRPLRGSCRAA